MMAVTLKSLLQGYSGVTPGAGAAYRRYVEPSGHAVVTRRRLRRLPDCHRPYRPLRSSARANAGIRRTAAGATGADAGRYPALCSPVPERVTRWSAAPRDHRGGLPGRGGISSVCSPSPIWRAGCASRPCGGNTRWLRCPPARPAPSSRTAGNRAKPAPPAERQRDPGALSRPPCSRDALSLRCIPRSTARCATS